MPEDWGLVWEAFAVLSESRPVGMCQGAIPLSEIEVYLRMTGIRSRDETQAWLYLIREMDREFLAHANEDTK